MIQRSGLVVLVSDFTSPGSLISTFLVLWVLMGLVAGQVSSFLLLSSLELSDTQVYEPYIRALLGTDSHFCEVVVLKLCFVRRVLKLCFVFCS